MGGGIIASAHILIDLDQSIKQLCEDYSASQRFSSRISSARLEAFRVPPEVGLARGFGIALMKVSAALSGLRDTGSGYGE